MVCSAYTPTDSYDLNKLIIDQTLNWAFVETEDEAIYLTGLFNSEAINLVIGDFQPEGAFGKRHIHSLPFGVTPPFDSLQEVHQNVLERTRELIAEYNEVKINDAAIQNALNPTISTLARRRSIITARLRALGTYEAFDLACRTLYGV